MPIKDHEIRPPLKFMTHTRGRIRLRYNGPSEDGQATNTNLQYLDFPTMGGRLRITEVKTKAVS